MEGMGVGEWREWTWAIHMQKDRLPMINWPHPVTGTASPFVTSPPLVIIARVLPELVGNPVYTHLGPAHWYPLSCGQPRTKGECCGLVGIKEGLGNERKKKKESEKDDSVDTWDAETFLKGKEVGSVLLGLISQTFIEHLLCAKMSKTWFLNLALETVDAIGSTWIAFVHRVLQWFQKIQLSHMLIFQTGKLSQGHRDFAQGHAKLMVTASPLVLLLLYHTQRVSAKTWFCHTLGPSSISWPNSSTTGHKNVGCGLGFDFFTHQL